MATVEVMEKEILDVLVLLREIGLDLTIMEDPKGVASNICHQFIPDFLRKISGRHIVIVDPSVLSRGRWTQKRSLNERLGKKFQPLKEILVRRGLAGADDFVEFATRLCACLIGGYAWQFMNGSCGADNGV